MNTFLLPFAVLIVASMVMADCGGTYQNNHTYYSEGVGGTSVYSLRDTYVGGKWCCSFNKDQKLKLVIKSLVINGILGAEVSCYKGGVGFDYVKYVLRGPKGKGQVLDVYADWIGPATNVPGDAVNCHWKFCGWQT